MEGVVREVWTRNCQDCGVPEAVFGLPPTENVGEAHVQSRIPPGSRACRAGKECGKAGPGGAAQGSPRATSRHKLAE